MADIFDELEEDLKEQKIYDFWRAWGNWIIGGALLIVIGAAGVPVWKYYHHSIKADESARFESALKLAASGKREDAQKILSDLSSSGKTGYAQLAALEQAALDLHQAPQKGSAATDEALKTYQTLSLREASNLSFSGLAKVLSGYAGISSNQAASLEAQFTPLAVQGNPWQALGQELQGLYALEKGDKMKASENFNEILNAKYVSQQSASRALLMLASLKISPRTQENSAVKE